VGISSYGFGAASEYFNVVRAEKEEDTFEAVAARSSGLAKGIASVLHGLDATCVVEKTIAYTSNPVLGAIGGGIALWDGIREVRRAFKTRDGFAGSVGTLKIIGGGLLIAAACLPPLQAAISIAGAVCVMVASGFCLGKTVWTWWRNRQSKKSKSPT
jgi:hypothetical protein